MSEPSRRAVDDALMAQATADMARLSEADPQGWAEYVDEGGSFEAGTVDRIV